MTEAHRDAPGVPAPSSARYRMGTARSLVAALAALVVAVVALSGCSTSTTAGTPTAQQDAGGTPTGRGAATVFAVGDCVGLPASTPAAPSTISAQKVACGADPSYTVGAMTDRAGACPSAEYQHLSTRFADDATARLCLVPNLVADHCYELRMPVGLVALADCGARSQAGLLVQITQRLDVRDQRACAAGVGQYAWPYPSPPRTYCTLTVF